MCAGTTRTSLGNNVGGKCCFGKPKLYAPWNLMQFSNYLYVLVSLRGKRSCLVLSSKLAALAAKVALKVKMT